MKAGGAVNGVGLPTWKNGLGAGKKLIFCCQSKLAKPQTDAACMRLKPRLGVKLALIVVEPLNKPPPLRDGPDRALLIREEHAVADEIGSSSEKYAVPPLGLIGTMKLTVPLRRSGFILVKKALGPPYPVLS